MEKVGSRIQNKHLGSATLGGTYHPVSRAFLILGPSVADPGCLSWIPDRDFCPSRIPDLGSQKQQQKTGVKKIVVKPFFVAKKFT
jgi:hypothetical protein